MATFTKRIAAAGDDCSSYTGSFLANNVIGGYFVAANTCAGFRFIDVTIPQGSEITSAKITLISAGNYSGATCNLRIYGVDEDDFDGFSNTANDRPHDYSTITTAYTNWSSVSSWTTGSSYDTPDIKTVVQEIVDRVGWVSGNDMGLILRDNSSSASAYRVGVDYSTTSGNAALLTIEYNAPITFIPQITFI